MTLIEVMVAITIISMMAVTIWTALSQTARTRDILSQTHDRLHEVRLAFEFMTRDLSSAFLSNHRAPSEPKHDPVFVGRNEGDEDRLDFATFTHQRRYVDAKESDQAEVGYFLEDDPEKSGVKNLVRRESPVLDLEPFEGGQYLILAHDVTKLDFQYFDLPMNEWQDQWDTTETTGETGFLPHQVRIKLVVRNRFDEEVAYATQTAIPMRTPIWRKYGFMPGLPPSVTK